MMEVLVVGKPTMNIYLPLQEFPAEGDIFNIRGKNESLGNVAATAAVLLGKWGISTHVTGVTGNDAYGEKIRDTFKEYKINTKYLETDFERSTPANYIILNVKTGMVTKVLYNDPEMGAKKYKYDFRPTWAILDGSDQLASHALLNNDASVKTVFYARVGDRDTIAMSKRCTHVVCTQTFAEQLTKTTTDFSAESLVAFYQRIVDAVGSSNYVVILNNHKILYSEEGKVKMLPEMKINEADKSSFDSVFTSALSFGLICGLSMNDAIKLGNTAAAMSLSKIGEAAAVPELDDVLANSGLKEKLDAAIKGEEVDPNASVAVEPAPLNQEYAAPAQETVPVMEQAPVEATPTVQEYNISPDVQVQVVPQGMEAQPNAFEAAPVQEPMVQQMPVEQTVAPQMPVEGVPTPVEMPQVVAPQPVDPTNTTNV